MVFLGLVHFGFLDEEIGKMGRARKPFNELIEFL